MTDMYRVNELPVLTFRFLGVNAGELAFEADGSHKDHAALEPADGKIPQGVTIEHGISYEVFRDSVMQIRRRLESADNEASNVKPNGDTTSRHDEQAIRTGMGIDIDRLMDHEGIGFTRIDTENGTEISEPVIFRPDDLQRLFIHVGRNSSLKLITDVRTAADHAGIQLIVLLEHGASLDLSEVNMCGADTTCFWDVGAVCLKDSRFDLTELSLGGKTNYSGCHTELAEDGAQITYRTAALVNGAKTYDNNYVAVHRGRDTKSEMKLNAVLSDSASKIFRGTIDFRAGSSGSAGNEQEDVLILSPDAKNRSMPVILCQEENVDGRHGASVGDLSEDMLFYMASRGIDAGEAKKILINARLMSVARLIPDKAIVTQAEQYLRETM